MNTAQINAIATHLEISPNQIKRVEIWEHILFVVAYGLGGRFVSKRVTRHCDCVYDEQILVQAIAA